MGSHLTKLIGVDFAIQLVGWAISAIFHTEKFFDLTGMQKKETIYISFVGRSRISFYSGSLTFVALTYLSRNKGRRTFRQNVQSACVLMWALR